MSDLDGHPVYGLLRRSALQKVGPMKAIAGGDILLALELALIGRWVLIDEELFFYRVNVKASWEVQRDRLAGNSKIKGDTAAWAHLRRALIGAVQEAPLSHFERTLCLTALVGGFVRRGWLMRDAVIRRHNRLEEHVARRRYGAALIESVPYVLMQPSRAMERRFWRSAFERLRAERRRRP